MPLGMYSIHDTKSGAFTPPFVARARGEAIRSFQAAIQDSQHPMSKFPADYVLYHVGTFFDDTGAVSDLPQGRERLIGGDEF